MTSEQGLTEFIASSFRSVWAIELLCHLRQAPAEQFTPEDLVQSLRASEAVVRQSIAGLAAGGLAVVGEDGRVRYQPASDDLDRLAAAAQMRYSVAPDAVRRIIVRSANEGLAAFANAFRLKGTP